MTIKLTNQPPIHQIPGLLKAIISGFLISLFFVATSCDIYYQEDYEEFVVIETYLVANSPLPEIHITTTSPVEKVYNRDSLRIRNANVQVTLLDENGDDKDQFPYFFSHSINSYTTTSLHQVQPNATYRLDVNFSDRTEVVRAFTTIPDEFNILNELPESITYQSSEQLEITVSSPKNSGIQNVFVFSAIALNPTIDNLTPFYRASFDDENIELSDVIINSSGLINEGNFEMNPDGTITLRFPWLGVAFFGETQIVINSVDRNLADLVRSQQVQLGGSTLSPGEIPNIIYNIEGGIGVFGSISSDTARTNFLRP